MVLKNNPSLDLEIYDPDQEFDDDDLEAIIRFINEVI